MINVYFSKNGCKITTIHTKHKISPPLFYFTLNKKSRSCKRLFFTINYCSLWNQNYAETQILIRIGRRSVYIVKTMLCSSAMRRMLRMA